MPVTAELTIGLERIAMYLQNVDSIFDLQWNETTKYGDVHLQSEVEYSRFSFEQADIALNFELFDKYEAECKRLVAAKLPLPAYDYCMKSSHAFNLLDARGAISVTERQRYIGRVRGLARACAEAYLLSRAELGFPLLDEETGVRAKAAFDETLESGIGAAARAAARAAFQPGDASGKESRDVA
jgi:glycyl-tRNA synthetase alpha chain